MAITAFFIAMLVPNFLGGRPKAALSGCERSQRVTAAALESYAGDHAGQFPPELAALAPRYLNKSPTCPASGKAPLYVPATPPQTYTLYCAGSHHVRAWALFESVPFGPSSGVSENFPQYTPQRGPLQHRPRRSRLRDRTSRRGPPNAAPCSTDRAALAYVTERADAAPPPNAAPCSTDRAALLVHDDGLTRAHPAQTQLLNNASHATRSLAEGTPRRGSN